MTQPYKDEPEVVDQDEQRRSNWLEWPALVAAGWLIYDLTAMPNLGAALVCLKFGWNDFRTAFWLSRRDWYAPRGVACFWLYLASGLWKTAMMALVTIFTFAFLAASLAGPKGKAQQPNALPAWFGTVALTVVVGFGLSAIATWLALIVAWIYNLKLWLSTSVHRSRRKDQWPPCDTYSSPLNSAGRVLLSAMIVTVCPLALTVCIGCGVMLTRAGFHWMAMVLMFGGVFGLLPSTLLLARDAFDRRIVARTPWECWSVQTPEEGFGWEDHLSWQHVEAPPGAESS